MNKGIIRGLGFRVTKRIIRIIFGFGVWGLGIIVSIRDKKDCSRALLFLLDHFYKVGGAPNLSSYLRQLAGS